MIIDISNEVFTNLKTNISTASVYMGYPEQTPSFPCVTFDDLPNTTPIDLIDSGGEKFNNIGFEVNIFTVGLTKKSDAKALRSAVDSIMSGTYGMNRTFDSPTPNFVDLNVYRHSLRYTAVVDSSKKIYRR